MARRKLPYQNADAEARGVVGRVLAHKLHRNVLLEVCQGSADDRIELHVLGHPLGELVGVDPKDALHRLVALVDTFHAAAANPGDPLDPF